MKRTLVIHRRLLVGLVLFVAAVGAGTTSAPATTTTIVSAGPLTNIGISTDLNCSVDHAGDAHSEFYGGTACATLAVVDGTLYGPATIPAGSSAGPRTTFTPVSQTAVTGAGTSASPYRIQTVVNAGSTGAQFTQTDSYVVGEESYRTDLVVTSTAAHSLIVYFAGDCYLQNSDTGFGRVDGSAVACRGVDGVGNPGDRIEQWYPLTGGSRYMEDRYSAVWARIGSKQAFPNTCLCTTRVDNGAGLSWSSTIGAGGSATFSHLTTFSPLGHLPLATTKTADSPAVVPGGTAGYTITFRNPNATPGSLSTIIDTLPAGFTYVPGSSSGGTTTDPAIVGQTLTWTGPFIVPANGALTQHFQSLASSVISTYYNNAGGTSPDLTVAPTGNTAPVSVANLPTVSISDPRVIEGNSGTRLMRFRVALSAASAGVVQMVYGTSNGTASSGADYVGVAAPSRPNLVFTPGLVAKYVDIAVKGDLFHEGNETFNVNLKNPVGAIIGDPVGVGTIIDEEGPFYGYITDVWSLEGNSGGKYFTFVVTLSASPLSGESTVLQVVSAPGTAVPPADYSTIPLTSLGFTHSTGRTKYVRVAVRGDRTVEGNENFLVQLTSARHNAVVADPQGMATIVNDD